MWKVQDKHDQFLLLLYFRLQNSKVLVTSITKNVFQTFLAVFYYFLFVLENLNFCPILKSEIFKIVFCYFVSVKNSKKLNRRSKIFQIFIFLWFLNEVFVNIREKNKVFFTMANPQLFCPQTSLNSIFKPNNLVCVLWAKNLHHEALSNVHMGDFTQGGEWLLKNVPIFSYVKIQTSINISIYGLQPACSY